MKIAVVDNPTIVWRPHLEKPQWITPYIPYISRNESHWPTFLPLIVWICLHSNFCSGLQNTHLFCSRVRIGRSRSSKVNDFGTSRKRIPVCDFLLVRHSNIGPILHRFWDTATYWLKIAHLHTRLTFGALAPYVPFEVRSEVNHKETSHGAILQWRPHDRFATIPSCDRRSDGRNLS